MRKENRTIHFEHLDKTYRIELEKQNEGYPDLSGMVLVSTAKLFDEEKEIGFCQFTTYRKRKNECFVGLGNIAFSLDAISSRHANNFERIASVSTYILEENFNDSAVVVADTVEIEPPYRGSGLWKKLYAHTLQFATEKLRRIPDEFYFEAFPLEFSGYENFEAIKEDFKRERDKLVRLYEYELKADIESESDNMLVMSAGVQYVLSFLDDRPATRMRMR